MHGQRFSFQDTIIMNVFNLSQAITLTPPDTDMVLKVRAKESFGVNAAMVLKSNGKVIAQST